MVSLKELKSRIKDFLKFNKQEVLSLVPAILATALIFSFRDWGTEAFDFWLGFKNLFTVIMVITISLFFRLSCQKIYGLSIGYKSEFKVWWTGLIIALVVAFISAGYVPLVLVGTVATAFMVRQRLGEFRYGFSYLELAMTSLWGILGNLIIAILFAVGLYFFPQNYFFSKGLIFNIIMAACALLPLPQLDGLGIYFGSRGMYILGIFTVLLGAVLLLTKTRIGLIAAIIIAVVASIVYLLQASEK